MTLMIEIPKEKEKMLREAAESHNNERLQQILGDLATPAVLALFTKGDDPLDILDLALQKLQNRTPNEVEAAQAAARALIQSPRHTLPEGKMLSEVFISAWPGDESDAMVSSALEKLS
jgi:hypothetical protein